MSKTKPKKCGRQSKPKLKRSDIRGSKLLAQIIDRLRPLHAHCPDPKRQLHFDEYCAWLLLYFFTPAIASMRGLQQASEFDSIRRKLALPRFSLGSFSEAGTVFDPELLVPIMEEIGQCLGDIEADPRVCALERIPTAVDGTLLRALPKMVWALWIDPDHRAAKLHLQFDLIKGAPHRATLTEGNASETRQLRQNLEPGRLYIDDRGYFDYDLMAATLAALSSFLTRVRDNIAYEVLSENPIAEDAARQGVVSDQIVRVGSKRNKDTLEQPLRLVRIHMSDGDASARRPNRVDAKTKLYRTRESEYTLVLLTDRLDIDVLLIALLYRYRWQIELFFRWFKKVLQADRLLSLSQNGMTIVIYCALIASMLISLWTGCKPTKRTFEVLCFYFSGLITDEELQVHLHRLAAREKNR
jgi:hypothetical protein